LKGKEQKQARKMRRNGSSVGDIAAKLGVSKSSASLWVRGISLTDEQLTLLKNSSSRGAAKSGAIKREACRQVRIRYQEKESSAEGRCLASRRLYAFLGRRKQK
jgi:transposase